MKFEFACQYDSCEQRVVESTPKVDFNTSHWLWRLVIWWRKASFSARNCAIARSDMTGWPRPANFRLKVSSYCL